MPDWACRRCGEVNLKDQRACAGCGRARHGVTPPKREPRTTPVYTEPAWMKEPPPCTPEEDFRALQIVSAVLDRDITTHQGHLMLNALFGGRELEDGQSVCECGIEMPYAPRGARA